MSLAPISTRPLDTCGMLASQPPLKPIRTDCVLPELDVTWSPLHFDATPMLAHAPSRRDVTYPPRGPVDPARRSARAGKRIGVTPEAWLLALIALVALVAGCL